MIVSSLDRLPATGAAALLFAATFVAGWRVHPVQRIIPDRRAITSFGAGMSAAYVFVHVTPELHAARSAFAESVAMSLRFDGMAIYFLALVGFLTFYGIDHLHLRRRSGNGGEGEAVGLTFKIHIGGFAAYVGLMGYLLVNNLEDTRVSVALFAVAIACHFLALDHDLHSEHGAEYERIGRFVLAGAAILGWGAGLAYQLPRYVVALLVAFISGAIIVNSTVMELQPDNDGHVVPFITGGVVYGLILLPLQ